MADNKKNKWALFLIGCFSMTQIRIIGFIGISELVLFVLAPFYLVRDWKLLEKHGFKPIVYLALLTLAGAFLANHLNNINFARAIRGIASPYAIFAIIVCLHHFLYPNIFNLKWLIIGLAISGVLSIFVFQQGSARSSYGELLEGSEAIESVVGYRLFWVRQLSTWLTLPIKVAFSRVPFIYIIAVGIYLPLYALIEAGGRSSYIALLLSFALLIVGGRQRNTMLRIQRNLWLFVTMGILAIYLGTAGYRFAATRGFMGEAQQIKYEKQTQIGKSPLALLMGGRMEFFTGLHAALDKPIIGHGSWAFDTKGYSVYFLEKYGNTRDYERYRMRSAHGWLNVIPAHSHIIGFWLWYGIFGLVFWLYVLKLYVHILSKQLAVIPSWYGYLAMSLPPALWNLFFSPFGRRIDTCAIIVTCLFVKAVAERRLVLAGVRKFHQPKGLTAAIRGYQP